MENAPLQMLIENEGSHLIYRLRDDDLDEVLGEAVVSQSECDIRLHGIFVKPQYRRRGHGTTLMEAVLGLGGTKLVTLCTGLGNVGFFKRFGFEVTAIGESLVSMERRL